MEKNKVFVGGLPWAMDSERLAEVFQEFGTVIHANVVADEDGRSKGFGFVEFDNAGSAKEAMQLNGAVVDGRAIRVSEATKKKRQPERTLTADGGSAAQARNRIKRRKEELLD